MGTLAGSTLCHDTECRPRGVKENACQRRYSIGLAKFHQ
jgi:hypothetical protein